MKPSFLFKLKTEGVDQNDQNVELSRYSQFLENDHLGAKLSNMACCMLHSKEGYVSGEEHFTVIRMGVFCS